MPSDGDECPIAGSRGCASHAPREHRSEKAGSHCGALPPRRRSFRDVAVCHGRDGFGGGGTHSGTDARFCVLRSPILVRTFYFYFVVVDPTRGRRLFWSGCWAFAVKYNSMCAVDPPRSCTAFPVHFVFAILFFSATVVDAVSTVIRPHQNSVDSNRIDCERRPLLTPPLKHFRSHGSCNFMCSRAVRSIFLHGRCRPSGCNTSPVPPS